MKHKNLDKYISEINKRRVNKPAINIENAEDRDIVGIYLSFDQEPEILTQDGELSFSIVSKRTAFLEKCTDEWKNFVWKKIKKKIEIEKLFETVE